MDRPALRGARFAALVGLVGLGVPSCGSSSPSSLPPLGEALVVVDTNLSLSLVQRLRVDVYEGGQWIQSRDLLASSREAWPASFSVYSPSPDPSGERTAIVRLRLYPEGGTRPYQGEGYLPRDGSAAGPGERPADARDGNPRLLVGGIDVTPADEPVPLVTVDRLVRIHVVPGVRGSVRITLRGECLGTMGDLAGARTCVDDPAVMNDLVDAAIDPDMTLPTSSVVDTFPGPMPCRIEPRRPSFNDVGTALHDEEACVPGGLFFYGEPYSLGLFYDEGVRIPALLEPFVMDKWEVTVARFRAALRRGFVPPADDDPIVNDGPIELKPSLTNAANLTICSYSTTPIGREDYGVSCVSPAVARAFCQFEGGDLPTEVQWTYAAITAGRPKTTIYPWGDERPDCDKAIFGRATTSTALFECDSPTGGPAAVDARLGDRTLGTGIIGMHGGLSEWTLDDYRQLYLGCWLSASLREPGCADPSSKLRTVGGGNWRDPSSSETKRQSARLARSTAIGFRCVRPAGEPR